MNTIQNFRIGLFFVFTFVITGCSISSDQLDSFRTSNQPMALEDYYWDVNYNNINYRLIAIDLLTAPYLQIKMVIRYSLMGGI